MKRTICNIVTILLYCSIVLLPAQALAINLGFDKTGEAATKAGYGATDETTFASKIGIVIQLAIALAGVFFLALMVYAGYLWMTARGEEEPINKAQKIILSSIIGLVILAGSYSFTAFVLPEILGKTTGAPAEGPVGGAKVECCYLCSTWAVDCPNEYAPMSQADCVALKGKYVGLKTESECK